MTFKQIEFMWINTNGQPQSLGVVENISNLHLHSSVYPEHYAKYAPNEMFIGTDEHLDTFARVGSHDIVINSKVCYVEGFDVNGECGTIWVRLHG